MFDRVRVHYKLKWFYGSYIPGANVDIQYVYHPPIVTQCLVKIVSLSEEVCLVAKTSMGTTGLSILVSRSVLRGLVAKQ